MGQVVARELSYKYSTFDDLVGGQSVLHIDMTLIGREFPHRSGANVDSPMKDPGVNAVKLGT